MDASRRGPSHSLDTRSVNNQRVCVPGTTKSTSQQPYPAHRSRIQRSAGFIGPRKDDYDENDVAQIVSRLTCLQRLINKLVLPIVKMRRAVKYSLRDSRVSSQRNPAPASSPLTQESDSPRSITGNATYTSQKTPLQPQSSKTSHFESVDDILEDDHGSFGYLAQGVETSRISLNEVVSSLNDSAHPPSIPSLAAHTAVRHTFTNDVPDIRASPTLPRGILKRGISRVTSVYIHRAKSTTAHIRPSFKVSMMTAIVRKMSQLK